MSAPIDTSGSPLAPVLALCDEASAKSPDDFKTGQDHLTPAFREVNFHDAFMWLAGLVNRIEAEAKRAASLTTAPVITPAAATDCRAPYDLTDAVTIQCTAVPGHFGLHRAHVGGEADKRSLLMWGEDKHQVSIDYLATLPNPLALLPAAGRPGRELMEEGLGRMGWSG